jgi:glyoxylase-like metal-dependent hydrolase (beta-lactamase superfamily II)
MSEPKAVAARAEPVVPGVWTWTVSDDRIGGEPSSATAVEESPGEIIVIDPIRLETSELDKLGRVTAVLLTGSKHVRSSEHYRQEMGAAVWAPAYADLGELEPDETFSEGNEVPGGLRVIALRGRSNDESAFYLKRGKGVMIVGDSLINIPSYGGFGVLPEKHNPDVEKTKKSCRKLLDYEFDALLFAHGEPIREGAKQKLSELLKA